MQAWVEAAVSAAQCVYMNYALSDLCRPINCSYFACKLQFDV